MCIARSAGDATPEKETGELKPLIDLIFIVTLAELPFGMDNEVGIADTSKSGDAVPGPAGFKRPD
jgi:hypothetical protein